MTQGNHCSLHLYPQRGLILHVIKTTLERSLKANTEDDVSFEQMHREAMSVPRLKMNLIFKVRGHKCWKVLFLSGSHDQSARGSSPLSTGLPRDLHALGMMARTSILELLTPGLAPVADRLVTVQTDICDSFQE